MSKKKNQNREQKFARKCAVESLRFQVHFGLKLLGREDGDLFHKLAETEINFIDELDLTDDILQIKRLVEGVKLNLQVDPTSKKGDFCTSVTAIALGIARISVLDNIQIPLSWQEQISKKILTIYYPEDYRNSVVNWSKANGFNTSTYLGRPIVKFKHIFVIIERTRD